MIPRLKPKIIESAALLPPSVLEIKAALRRSKNNSAPDIADLFFCAGVQSELVAPVFTSDLTSELLMELQTLSLFSTCFDNYLLVFIALAGFNSLDLGVAPDSSGRIRDWNTNGVSVLSPGTVIVLYVVTEDLTQHKPGQR